jgi:hypothetical protein
MSILQAIEPVTFVGWAVAPDHLTVSMSLVVFELAIVPASCAPDHRAKSVFEIVFELASVDRWSLIASRVLASFGHINDNPLALSMLLTTLEHAWVGRAILPNVLASTIEFTLSEMANKLVAIRVFLCTITMPVRVSPLSFVDIL